MGAKQQKVKTKQDKKVGVVEYTCPPHTHARCRQFVALVMDKLNATEAVESIDLGAIDLLCGSYNLYCQSDEQVRKEGVTATNRYGELKPHPAVNVRHQAFNQCVAVMKELGLTIKSRSNLPVVQSDADEDHLAEFLS